MFGAQEESNEIVQMFCRGLHPYKQKRIVLYGLGIHTKMLLKVADDYRIVGVMDAKHEGEMFQGKKVFSEAEASEQADVIVIVARAEVVPVIYDRIRHLEQRGVQILDICGRQIQDTNTILENFPIQESEDSIKNAIISHDVICFDIFDTLVSRKVVQPEDIFAVVEQRLKYRGIEIEFKKLRQEAERMARLKSVSPTLLEIYREVKQEDINGMVSIEELMEEEIQAECDYSAGRAKHIELLKLAKKHGKTVYLVSDMYLNKQEIKRILDHCDIRDYDEIIVSCEYKKCKWPNGELFEVITRKETGSILHIGDNEGADVLCAKKAGLDAAKVLSAYEFMLHTPFRTLLSYNRTLGDSISIGMFAAKYLENSSIPFQTSTKLPITAYDAGYICYGALVVGFLSWIKQQCSINHYTNLAFVARDGWILEKVWRLMKEKSADADCITAKYILGSRRALAIPALRNEQDLFDALSKVPPNMAIPDMMNSRFGLNGKTFSQEEGKGECVRRNKTEILEHAKEERTHYRSYIKEQFDNQNDIAVIDAVSSGTIAQYFFNAVDRKGTLLCLLLSRVPDYSVYDEIDSKSYFGEDSKYMPRWNIHRHIGALESCLTAPHSMFCYFDKDGSEVYADKEASQKHVEILQMVHQGIMDFAKEMLMLLPDISHMELTPALCDTFFGLLYEKNICIGDDNIKKLGVNNKF